MLVKEIKSFVEDSLISYLRRNSQKMLDYYDSSSDIDFIFTNSAYMKAKVTRESRGKYLIEISKGWILRLGIIYSLSDYYWTNCNGRRSIHIATQETAYDSYIFRESIPPNSLFLRSRPMEYLFLDHFSEEILSSKVLNFATTYSEFDSEMDNLPKFTGLELPSTFSKKAKMDLLISMSFLCFHEVAHTLEKQTKWLNRNEFNLVSGETLFNSFENQEYKLKCAEADADISAVNWTLNSYCNINKSFSRQDIYRIFEAIFIFLATFDLGRQSIRAYQGLGASKSSHPIADLRAVILMYGLFEGLNSGPNKIELEEMYNIFDTSIVHAIRTLEAFAIANCGYYILANKLISAQHHSQGFISQLTMMFVMQEELTKIEDRYRELRDSSLIGKNFWIWRPYGFHTSDEKFKEACTQEFYAIFVDKERENFNGQLALEEFFQRKRSEMEEGDHLLFFQHEFPDDIATNTEKYKADDRYSNMALKLIFDTAGVEVRESEDGADS